MVAYVVVRVRGKVGVKEEIEETLRRMRLTRVNHAEILPDNPVVRGMLQKAKDYITWGEISAEVLEEAIRKRGEFLDGAAFSEEELKKRYGKTLKSYVKELISGKVRFSKLFKPLRLHPPRKGYRSIKKPFKAGGALGYRGEAINDLLRRMI